MHRLEADPQHCWGAACAELAVRGRWDWFSGDRDSECGWCVIPSGQRLHDHEAVARGCGVAGRMLQQREREGGVVVSVSFRGR